MLIFLCLWKWRPQVSRNCATNWSGSVSMWSDYLCTQIIIVCFFIRNFAWCILVLVYAVYFIVFWRFYIGLIGNWNWNWKNIDWREWLIIWCICSFIHFILVIGWRCVIIIIVSLATIFYLRLKSTWIILFFLWLKILLFGKLNKIRVF